MQVLSGSAPTSNSMLHQQYLKKYLLSGHTSYYYKMSTKLLLDRFIIYMIYPQVPRYYGYGYCSLTRTLLNVIDPIRAVLRDRQHTLTVPSKRTLRLVLWQVHHRPWVEDVFARHWTDEFLAGLDADARHRHGHTLIHLPQAINMWSQGNLAMKNSLKRDKIFIWNITAMKVHIKYMNMYKEIKIKLKS